MWSKVLLKYIVGIMNFVKEVGVLNVVWWEFQVVIFLLFIKLQGVIKLGF